MKAIGQNFANIAAENAQKVGYTKTDCRRIVPHACFDIHDAFKLMESMKNEEINAWMVHMGETFSNDKNIKDNGYDSIKCPEAIEKFNVALPAMIPPIINAAALLHPETYLGSFIGDYYL